jgi:hypothetical protein
MVVTLAGSATLVRPRQFANALVLISVTFVGTDMAVSALQY